MEETSNVFKLVCQKNTFTDNSSQLGESMALLLYINESEDCKYVNTNGSKQLHKYLNG